MSWFQKKLTELRDKPYEQRVRILRNVTVIVALLVVLLWVLTIRYRKPGAGENQFRKFAPIWENLKKLRE